MKKLSILVVLPVVALILAACGGTVGSGAPGTQGKRGTLAEGAATAGKEALLALDTQTNDAGQVAVDVTPLSIDGELWDFQVNFNTHSVNLAFDPAQTSVLRCDQGQEFSPLAWEGSGPGGHHRSGVLSFARPDHPVSSVEIVIRDVAEVSERLFRWTIQDTTGSSSDASNQVPSVEDLGPPHLALSDGEFDFGDVPMSQGAVSRELQITNTGGGTLRIEGVEPT